MANKEVIDIIKNAISLETHYDVNDLQDNQSFETMGLESVVMVSVINRLEKVFGSLPKTLLFEYGTIKDLSEYLSLKYSVYEDTSERINNLDTTVSKNEDNFNSETSDVETKSDSILNIENLTVEMSKYDDSHDFAQDTNDVAIIGIYGRFPMADNLDEFWNNLVDGKDCISEIPDSLIEKNSSFGNLSEARWGGFIKGIDKFDPLFFNMSNREAEMIDPQERLLLEEVYHTLEDAGYHRKRLNNSKVGVYMGAMWNQYQLYGNIDGSAESFISSLANRISYFFDFNGPSIGVDTMCSSSLTSVYLACMNLKNKDIDYALAGGVNLDMHPSKHLYLSKLGFAARDGRCRSFGEGGTGYVPGDGVGAVMLKRLSDAIKDGDRIHAVIKSIEINHSGKSTGYSAPNPNSQVELMEKTFLKTDISPADVGYMEMHGTGTALGDPIEVRAATKFFSKYVKHNEVCPIGSVKSNIGHLEAAAGFSQIAKVLLQFKHSKLVPSIHSQVLNKNIDFEKTPFYVQRELCDWPNKYKYINGKKEVIPKTATVSSFGAGGSNSFMILQEWKNDKHRDFGEITDNDVLILLSAKTEASLKNKISNIIDFLSAKKSCFENKANIDVSEVLNHIKKYIVNVQHINGGFVQENDSINDFGISCSALLQYIQEKYLLKLEDNIITEDVSLTELSENIAQMLNYLKEEECRKNKIIFLNNLSYTLQVGREHLNVRTYVIGNSLEDIISKLSYVLSNYRIGSEVVSLNSKTLNVEIKEKHDNSLIESLMLRKRLVKLGSLWLKGIDISWEEMYKDMKCSIISAPVYPFEKECCWIQNDEVPNSDFKPVDIIKHYDNVASGEDIYKAFKFIPKNYVIDSIDYNDRESVIRYEFSKFSYDELLNMANDALGYQLNSIGKNNLGIKIKNIKIISDIPKTGYLNLKIQETIKGYIVNKNSKLCAELIFDFCNSDAVLPDNLFYDVKYEKIEDYKKSNDFEKNSLIVYSNGSQRFAKITKKYLNNTIVHELNADDGIIDGFNNLEKLKDIEVVHFLMGLTDNTSLDDDFEKFKFNQFKCMNTLFELAKLVQSLNKKIKIKVFTNNTSFVSNNEKFIQPYYATLAGFARGIAKEIKNLNCEIVDINLHENSESIVEEDFKIACCGVKNIDEYFIRGGILYQQTLAQIVISHTGEYNNFKRNGVYVLIGGNGTVGRILTDYLSKNYSSKIIWIGRRKINEDIKTTIEEVNHWGGNLSYYSADISSEKNAMDVFEAISRENGNIDGIFHCAMDFKPVRFSNLTGQKIEQGIAAKVYGGYVISKVVEKFKPDVVIMFSSAESFTSTVGWSVYSAACGFKDSIAKYINLNSNTRSIVINWGFWQLPDEEDNEMFIKKGIYPIDSKIGMAALETILSSNKQQVVAMNVSKKVLDLMRVVKSKKEISEAYGYEKSKQYAVTAPIKSNYLSPEWKIKLDNEIKKIISETLKINFSKIKSDSDLSNYGIDSIVVGDIHSKIEKFLGYSVPATLLLENETLNDVVEYLVGNVTSTKPIKEENSENILHIMAEIKTEDIESFLKNYGNLYRTGDLQLLGKNSPTTLDELYAKAKDNFVHFKTLVNNKTVEGFVIGQGKPVLMISPIGLTAPIWQYQFLSLYKDNLLIVIHQPGYGLSEIAEKSNNKAVSDIIISTLSQLKINKDITVLGSCFGSITATYLAKNYPEMISKICLIGGFYDGSDLPEIDFQSMKLEDLKKMASEISASIGKDFDVIIKDLGDSAIKKIQRFKNCKALLLDSQCANSLICLRYLNEIKSLSTVNWLRELNQNVLCVYGDLDTVIPVKRSYEISEMTKNSLVVKIDGAGHYPYLTHPKEFNKILNVFIKEKEK